MNKKETFKAAWKWFFSFFWAPQCFKENRYNGLIQLVIQWLKPITVNEKKKKNYPPNLVVIATNRNCYP